MAEISSSNFKLNNEMQLMVGSLFIIKYMTNVLHRKFVF